MDSQVNQRKDQRIVWLLNHTTLREFEVPLMRRLGLEVYCPKRFPRNPDNRSASVSDEFDSMPLIFIRMPIRPRSGVSSTSISAR